jgi:hypothetical protein
MLAMGSSSTNSSDQSKITYFLIWAKTATRAEALMVDASLRRSRMISNVIESFLAGTSPMMGSVA